MMVQDTERRLADIKHADLTKIKIVSAAEKLLEHKELDRILSCSSPMPFE